MIEGWLSCPLFRFDDDEFISIDGRGDAIPELPIIVEPMRLNTLAIDLAARDVKQIGRPLVIGLGPLGMGSGNKCEGRGKKHSGQHRWAHGWNREKLSVSLNL